MNDVDELAPFGVFVARDFLAGDALAAVSAAFAVAPGVPTPVYSAEARSYVHDGDSRRVSTVALPPDVDALLRARFDGALGAMSAAFPGEPLTEVEPLSYLRYGVGGHFHAHRDVSHDAEAKHARRRVSLVLFVDGPEAYEGGALLLCVFGDDPRAELLGLEVRPPAGTLLGFRSDLVHQVRPVTGGTRTTVVTWAS